MEARFSLLEEELSCPICFDIFSNPLVLKCSHSFCKDCLEQIWERNERPDCPVCRRGCLREEAVSNLVLKNACKSFLQVRGQRVAAMGPDVLCVQHGEKLKLFCLQDQLPVCVICQTSKQHGGHRCCPVEEAMQGCRDKLRTALEPLRENLDALRKVKQNCDGAVQHVMKQTQHTERQIKREFERLHRFLLDEEATRITALREEEVERSQKLKGKIEATDREILSLSEAIRAIEREMAATDNLVFLQNYKDTMKKSQHRLGDSENIAGVLIDVAKHLACLKYRVWEKMKDIAEYSPVTLDPNTANPYISLSQDLTSLRYSKRQNLPANLERFDPCMCVLGTEGFTSGRHFWDVEVGDNTYWILGVAQESVKRKEKFSTYPENGFWTIRLRHGQYRAPGTSLAVTEKLQRVRVQLDWDRGALSFFDATDNTPLYTFTHTFTERLFPFFCTGSNSKPLSILPVQVSLKYQ